MKKTLSWSQLQRLQNTKVLKSMYVWLVIVPVAAKILSSVNEQLALNIFGADIVVNFTLPFTWQIFYFSSVLIVIGNIVFEIKCPRILKEHPNYSHFREEGKAAGQLVLYAEEVGVCMKKFDFLGPALSYGPSATKEESKVQEAFWSVFSAAEKMASISRSVTSICYMAGLFLIATVVVENLTWVVKLMFGHS